MTVLPGGTPDRRVTDDRSRAAEVHSPSGFEDKLLERKRYPWSPAIVGELPTKGRGGVLTRSTNPTLPYGRSNQDHCIK